MALNFYICEHCSNIITFAKKSGVPVVCCGQKMKELIPSSTDAAVEKHVPVVTVDGQKVSVAVGSVTHPQTDAHLIEWIAIETDKGSAIKHLAPTDAPAAEFVLAEGESFVAAYAYCNLHGLWKN